MHTHTHIYIYIFFVTWLNMLTHVSSLSPHRLIRCWDATSGHEIYRITAGLGGLSSGNELCIWSLLSLRWQWRTAVKLTNMNTSAFHIHHAVIFLIQEYFLLFFCYLKTFVHWSFGYYLGLGHLLVRTAVVASNFGTANMELSCKHIHYTRAM